MNESKTQIKFTSIEKEIPKDGMDILVKYVRLSMGDNELIKYDVGRFRRGELFILGNHFHFDICKQVIGWTYINEIE